MRNFFCGVSLAVLFVGWALLGFLYVGLGSVWVRLSALSMLL